MSAGRKGQGNRWDINEMNELKISYSSGYIGYAPQAALRRKRYLPTRTQHQIQNLLAKVLVEFETSSYLSFIQIVLCFRIRLD